VTRYVLAYKGCIAWKAWHDGKAIHYRDRNGITVQEELDRTQWSYVQDAPMQAQTCEDRAA
jgi:hypothetical protein